MIAALRVIRSQNETEHVVERMATAIAERMDQKGECSIMHLRDMGFSLDNIARHWPQACKLVEIKRPNPWQQSSR
ncbi:MAG: hypothetical protein KGI37_04860 [Alphaproteobacteria bacterium]|nr:hypothetical protein [Alphaproteobacteria bacterium]